MNFNTKEELGGDPEKWWAYFLKGERQLWALMIFKTNIKYFKMSNFNSIKI